MPVLERAQIRATEREEQQVALQVEVAFAVRHLGHQIRGRRLEGADDDAVGLCANQ